jgi:YtkA-like
MSHGTRASPHHTRAVNSTALRIAFVWTLVCAVGCSSTSPTEGLPGSFPATPLMSMSSASGKLQVEVRSSPTQPPQLGDGAWSYTIMDAASGKPATGLSLDVVPWMPAMGHGTSTVPSVTDTGDGLYVIDDVVLFMPGQWDLRTTVSGPADDAFVVSVDIP